MGKYYENLETLITLVKKIEKKNLMAEFILTCIDISKSEPESKPHDIIKKAKEKILG